MTSKRLSKALLKIATGSALMLLVASVSGAYAQATGEGVMNAVSYKSIPPGATLSVRPMDNSDENLVLQRNIERTLTANGYRISPQADLILSFDTRDEIGAWTVTGKRSVLELEGRGGRGGGEDAKARLNLFDSSRGGMLNQGQGETNIVTPSHYRLEATIDSRQDGQRYWQSWTVGELGQYNALDLTSAMIPTMVENLGKTVRQKTFSLP